ncbi:MAG: tetratricopeptide repeat protein [Spirochaetota bacterium]|nr:tetratricopeptide repeat protein [Spirochaetota bacterium]
MIKKYFFLLIIITNLAFCKQEIKVQRYTIEYTEPYYAINLPNFTPVYKEPGDLTQIIHKLEAYQIVKLNATVSLEKPLPIWFYIEDSGVKGYALESNFKVFENQPDAETFLLKSHPGRGLIPILSIYSLSEKDFIRGDYQGSINKLYRFLDLKKDLEKTNPIIYYSTQLLIGRLYLNPMDAQKAIMHFNDILKNPVSNKEVELLGAYFNPKDVNFYIKEIKNLLTHQAFIHRKTTLNWDAQVYLGMAYELNGDRHLAKKIYLDILFNRRKYNTLQNQQFVAYLNFVIDRYLNLVPDKEKITFLMYLIKKSNWSSDTRYALYKIAELYETQANDKLNTKKTDNKKLALNYYKEFIKIFEAKQNKYNYPDEISHYINAKEKIKK